MKEPSAVELSPQTLSILTNLILHSFRFGMMEQLRREGPLWGLAKALGESVAGWFGRTPTWQHCQTQLQRAVTTEQFTAIYQELHWLEIDWRTFSGPISVFTDSPTQDPDWRLAHKIKTLKSIIQSRIDSYAQGALRPGDSGELFRSYKDQKVTELSPVVWRAFVAALDRLEEMRLARSGAKPWAEESAERRALLAKQAEQERARREQAEGAAREEAARKRREEEQKAAELARRRELFSDLVRGQVQPMPPLRCSLTELQTESLVDHEQTMQTWQRFKELVVATMPPTEEQAPAAASQLLGNLKLLDGIHVDSDLRLRVTYSGWHRDGWCDAVAVGNPDVQLFRALRIDSTVTALTTALFLAAALPKQWAWGHGLYDRDHQLVATPTHLKSVLEQGIPSGLTQSF